ncbi:hypothetical protein LK07_00835 [Streptomyces pluripotens]|uniref:Uncharacterized protein n=1 Tax=Streptomyces pluripotens TaxID=1355015 RepID=A0A221P7I0_9ACTN|nr:hypothetical protein LK07_00835 [Streptomyces pluripotens]
MSHGGTRSTSRVPRRRKVGSLAVWWLLLACALWLGGQAVDQAASPTACASSAALMVAIGEAGYWLQQRWAARNGGASAAVKRVGSRRKQG